MTGFRESLLGGLVLCLFLCSSQIVSSQIVHADDQLFHNSIRPLLEKKCLSCHNSTDRKGGLTLETFKGIMNGGESGPAITVGRPDASHLLDLITPNDGKAEMPKGSSPLTADEIAAVRAWIADGAKWPADVQLTPDVWWSLRQLTRPTVPTGISLPDVAGNVVPIRTPVDAFIQIQLQKRGLVPAQEADRRVLIRRLYFDLIGLPPSPEEIDQFVRDPSPRAYEDLVDHLLDSPRYGERWARHWLDVARYADTCGYDKDKLRRNAWPYRDYVIRSFNEDKPYSRFVEEQIAGDVLYPGSPDGILGLGFVAAGPWDHIGHTEVPESKIDGKIARDLDRDEMVTGTLNAFCSITVQCARCHDHKFDPISQAHYYGLHAVFAAVDRADREFNLSPEQQEARLALDKAKADAQQRLRDIEMAIQREMEKDGITTRNQELKDQIASLKKSMATAKYPDRHGYHSQISTHQNATKWVALDLQKLTNVRRIVLYPCYDNFAGIGAGFGFPVRFRVEFAATREQLEQGQTPSFVIDETQSEFSNPGLKPVAFSINADQIRYIRVTATQLAKRSEDYIFALAEIDVFDDQNVNLAPMSTLSSLDSIEAPVRWSLKNLTDGLYPKGQDEETAETLAAMIQEQTQLLQKYETPQRRQERDAHRNTIANVDRQLKELSNSSKVYAAATAFPPQGSFKPTNGTPREIRVLHRGNIQEPREVATAGALPLIPGVAAPFDLPPDHHEGDRRAALARWITRKDNPLTWRSIVNRIWQFHFGDGIAASPNDFGRMGEEPTHPELLDWLAIEFRDGGQSIKQLHRLIVNSSTYRQSSDNNVANREVDGSNRYLWRMNRRRLEAEEIRDAVLSVSGRLNLKMGGPGYFLFQLEKEVHSPHYVYEKFDSSDPTTHRRSVYRFIVRSQPDPFMTTLDCADSSQSTPRRNETVTALQALSLLNNQFNLRMSEFFAERLRSRSKETGEQLPLGFELITGRQAKPDEIHELQVFCQQHGLENTCRLLFNLNEFVYVD